MTSLHNYWFRVRDAAEWTHELRIPITDVSLEAASKRVRETFDTDPYGRIWLIIETTEEYQQ